MKKTGAHLSEIADSLSALKELTAWEVTHKACREFQLYTIFKDIENAREVTTEEYHVRTYLTYEKDGRTVLGESSFVLAGDELVGPKIQSALEMARLIANEPFALPSPAEAYPLVETVDRGIEDDPEDCLRRIHKTMAAFSSPGVRLSSSEIFVSGRSYTFLNSNHVSAVRSETEIMVDFVFLAEHGGREGEIEGIRQCRLFPDLDMEHSLARYGAYALDMLDAESPATGSYDVVFAEEALDTFFSYFAAQSGGQAAYQGWSQFRKDESIAGTVRGDRLTLISDPFMSGGMKSRPFDDNGLPQTKVTVIEDNVFKNRVANKRYADYLGVEATGDFANVVVAPGTRSFEDLISAGSTLYVLQFSTFQPNPVTGAFSGEIRVGYLADGRRRVPVKGGSVSGTMAGALQEMYFSRETTKRDAYLGPSAVKVCHLDIAGK